MSSLNKHPNEADAIKIGDNAPDFSLLNYDNTCYTLSEITKPLIIVFYRGDW